ncbi:MAG: hypothetical protein O2976_02430 [Actinomycetota bacterium]|nr:hypothetical protein [Actinomycetota bacterium]
MRSDDDEFGLLVVEVPGGVATAEEIVSRLENVFAVLAEVAAQCLTQVGSFPMPRM